jgi:hypothetical protein
MILVQTIPPIAYYDSLVPVQFVTARCGSERYSRIDVWRSSRISCRFLFSWGDGSKLGTHLFTWSCIICFAMSRTDLVRYRWTEEGKTVSIHMVTQR